jgi:hypothetical protein
LSQGATYRVDYLEVAPGLERAGIGFLSMCLVARRAEELGCQGVVVPSLAQALEFYRILGAQVGVERLTAPSGTVLCSFGAAKLRELREYLDEFAKAPSHGAGT